LRRGECESEPAVVQGQLIPRAPMCALMYSEGEDADRMRILTKGSVSVRLRSALRPDERRIASMAVGTTVARAPIRVFSARNTHDMYTGKM
jgi:hypothetical protein